MKSVSVSRWLLTLMGSAFLGGGVPVASAVDVDINITGEIYVSPCTINNDTDIQVSFGTMSVSEVDGYNNAKNTVVIVKCEGYEGTPYIQVGGTVLSGAGNNVLKTNGDNESSLGIALYQGFNVDSSYPIIIGEGDNGYGYPLTNAAGFWESGAGVMFLAFTAVPYKYGSDTLNAGSFTATATMSVNYL